MASTFMGLSIAGRGLSASQIGLATTTSNQSNTDTKGYSRQIVNQTSVGPAAVYSSSLVGGGATVTSVDRVRSDRLDQKYWQENSASNKTATKSSYLSQIESVFSTTDSDSISKELETFNTDLGTLSGNTNDTSVRETVLQDAENLCTTLNQTATDLTQLRNDVNSEVKTTVTKINADTKQIADLNKKIAVAKASGASTNELEDERGVVVDDLSGLVGINVTKTDDGALTITAGDTNLVSGNDSTKLECYTVTDTNSAQNGMYGIRNGDTGMDVDTGTSGALGGYLGVRDGNSSDNKGIPYYTKQLDTFTQTFAKAFNEGVTDGSTSYNGNADGVGQDGSTDVRFFSYENKSSADLMASGSDTDSVYKNITAANITVSKDVQEDTGKIATASATGTEGNSDNIADLVKIWGSADVSGHSTVAELYSSIISNVGNASAYAKTESSRQSTITKYIESSRSSVSGVNTNEETTNMTKYQSAYNASASAVTTWNEIYQATLDMVNT